MNLSVLLSVLLLALVTVSPLLFLTWSLMKSHLKTQEHLKALHLTESARVQTLMNLMLARDFPTFAGLQQLSQSQVSETTPLTSSPSWGSDYIPRDDATEALRLKNFGAGIGYGDVVFDPEDEDLAEALSEMMASGQVDLGGED